MDAHFENSNECKGAGLPLQYHLGPASGMVRKEMTCRVPQGLVLGPLVWNIAFEDILKEEVLPEVGIICYVMISW